MNTNIENPDEGKKYVSRLEALIEGQAYVLEMISRNVSIQEVLEGIVAWIERHSDGEVIASVLRADSEGKTLLHGAAPSLPDFFNAAVHGTPVQYGVGSCGTAAFLREQVIVDDIANDPLWQDYTDLTTRAGLGACWSTPLIGKQGDLLGTFAMYFRTPRKPTDNDLHIIRLVGRTLVIAIEHKLIEDEKQRLQLNEHTILEAEVQERTRELSKTNHELKEANLNLERVNNNLEQFAYVTSHDLQEPLRKIKIFSDILQTRSEVGLTNFTKKYLDKIEVSVDRMSALITDLLNFSRVEKSGKAFITTDLNVIIEEVTEDFELAIRDKQILLNISPLSKIDAIPLEMRQLFFNLIGNAIKFARQDIRPVININGRKLTAEEILKDESLNPLWPYYVIEVRDNGIGFDQKYASQIFTIFQRLHTREVYSGTGIGLALCQKVVNNHHGRIFAEGEENKGAGFFILLPIHR
jgi:signal transduction histidine kinase